MLESNHLPNAPLEIQAMVVTGFSPSRREVNGLKPVTTIALLSRLHCWHWSILRTASGIRVGLDQSYSSG